MKNLEISILFLKGRENSVVNEMKEKTFIQAVDLFKKNNKGKTIEVQTKGTSMLPLINENSRIKIKLIESEKLKTGDIIMFYRNQKFLLHRMLKRKKEKFLVKGDNSKHFDSLVKKNEIIGKAVEINGKKINSIEFELTKMPIVVCSLFRGILNRIKVKK